MIVTVTREFMFHKDREELQHTEGDPAAEEGPASSATTTEYHVACVPRSSAV